MSSITFIIRNTNDNTVFGKLVDDCLRENDDDEFVENIEKNLNELLNRINSRYENKHFNIGILGYTSYNSYARDISAFDVYIDNNQKIFKYNNKIYKYVAKDKNKKEIFVYEMTEIDTNLFK
jgi:hypothetical protein